MVKKVIVGGGTIGDLMKMLGGDDDEQTRSNDAVGRDKNGNEPLPEAIEMQMKEIYARYAGGNPFVPGQLITPAPGADVRGAGLPHLVLEVVEPFIQEGGDSDANNFRMRIDIRFLAYFNGHFTPFWGESWQFVPYEFKGV